MATNDNQTALMISIQRKKDRIEKTMMSEFEKQILEREITEDEKLLSMEREQWVKSYIMGRSDQHDQMNPGEWKGDEFILDSSERKFHEKHGTDGK